MQMENENLRECISATVQCSVFKRFYICTYIFLWPEWMKRQTFISVFITAFQFSFASIDKILFVLSCVHECNTKNKRNENAHIKTHTHAYKHISFKRSP